LRRGREVLANLGIMLLLLLPTAAVRGEWTWSEAEGMAPPAAAFANRGTVTIELSADEVESLIEDLKNTI
ncbi:MAG TPA: hypothetical protein PKM95_11045, partial [Deltaproteobacteria bacterium]|nr:hypothetical protein [Deltaproteobacteria bacterium]